MHFNDWLKKEGRKVFILLSGLSTLSVAQNIISYLGFSKLTIDNSRFVSYCLHLIVIVFILVRQPIRIATLPDDEDVLLLPEINQDSEKHIMLACGFSEDQAKSWTIAKQTANRALQLFRRCWMLLWLSFFLLYLILASHYLAVAIHGPFNNGEQVWGIGMNLFGNWANIALIFCYYILASPTISETHTKHSEPHWFRWITILIIASIVDVILTDYMINIWGNDYLKIQLPAFRIAFNWLLGIAGATALALFVGRLDSRFINAPIWVIALLYVYASIQPLFPVVETAELNYKVLSAVLTNAAFLLKIILFLFVTWLLESGRILFYFVRVRKLYSEVDDEWQEFSTILPNSVDVESSGT